MARLLLFQATACRLPPHRAPQSTWQRCTALLTASSQHPPRITRLQSNQLQDCRPRSMSSSAATVTVHLCPLLTMAHSKSSSRQTRWSPSREAPPLTPSPSTAANPPHSKTAQRCSSRRHRGGRRALPRQHRLLRHQCQHQLRLHLCQHNRRRLSDSRNEQLVVSHHFATESTRHGGKSCSAHPHLLDPMTLHSNATVNTSGFSLQEMAV